MATFTKVTDTAAPFYRLGRCCSNDYYSPDYAHFSLKTKAYLRSHGWKRKTNEGRKMRMKFTASWLGLNLSKFPESKATRDIWLIYTLFSSIHLPK